MDQKKSMKDKILFWIGTTMLVGIVTAVANLALEVRDLPTGVEVRHIVKSETPYVQDKKMIQEQLKRMHEIEAKLTSTIDRNTEAINALRVEIAKNSRQ